MNYQKNKPPISRRHDVFTIYNLGIILNHDRLAKQQLAQQFHETIILRQLQSGVTRLATYSELQ